MKHFRLFAAAFFVALFSAAPLFAADFELQIPFEVGADVVAIRNGQTTKLGTVLKLPSKSRWPSYTASAWGEPNAVCATAVNALHLLVGVEKGKGRTISIVPQDTIAPAAKPGTAFVVSTHAGTGCFGAWAPKVGSAVLLRDKNGHERKLSPENFIQQGETVVIRVTESPMPIYIEIENRPGGRVLSFDERGCHPLGRVLRPVAGTGRFEGTKFQNRSLLRANHPGVIDYSTCTNGNIGGFQIIPWDHALSSKEMQSAWDLTQWLIVAPCDGVSALCGVFPLFKDGLLPGTNLQEGEKLWDLWSTYGRRCPMLVRVNGGDWQKVPSSVGKQPYSLSGVTHIRIYYPHDEEPAKD